jgi:hypothetical protein
VPAVLSLTVRYPGIGRGPFQSGLVNPDIGLLSKVLARSQYGIVWCNRAPEDQSGVEDQEAVYITFSDGRTIEAIELSRTGKTIRALIRGAEDVQEFTQMHGRWVSEDLEAVHIEPAWYRSEERPVPVEDECLCAREPAVRLIRALLGFDRWAGR